MYGGREFVLSLDSAIYWGLETYAPQIRGSNVYSFEKLNKNRNQRNRIRAGKFRGLKQDLEWETGQHISVLMEGANRDGRNEDKAKDREEKYRQDSE